MQTQQGNRHNWRVTKRCNLGLSQGYYDAMSLSNRAVASCRDVAFGDVKDSLSDESIRKGV